MPTDLELDAEDVWMLLPPDCTPEQRVAKARESEAHARTCRHIANLHLNPPRELEHYYGTQQSREDAMAWEQHARHAEAEANALWCGMTRVQVRHAIQEKTPLVYYANEFPPFRFKETVIVVGTEWSGTTLHATGLDGGAWVGLAFSRLRPATAQEILTGEVER